MRKSTLFRYFFVFISVIWLCLMALLVQKSYQSRHRLPSGASFAAVDTQSGATQSPKDNTEWASIYLLENKIGYTMSLMEPESSGYRCVESSYMRFDLLGTDQDVRTFVRAQCNRDYTMRSFSFEMRSKNQSLKADGSVAGSVLQVTLTTKGATENLKFDLPDDAYMPVAVAPLIKEKGLKEGDSLAVTMFDPTALQPTKMWIRHMGSERIEHGGKTVETAHLTLTYLGTTMNMWVDANGKTLKEEGPMGIRIVDEPREMAEKFPDMEKRVELLTLFSIPANKAIANPGATSYLKLEIGGVEIDPKRIENNRQRIVSTSPLQMEINAIEPARGARIGDMKGLQQYLASEPLVQVDDPAIRAASDSIVKGKSDPWQRVVSITDWVYANLEKTPTVSIPSAAEVLATRRGDCNEHAILVTALSRAAGIPATVAAGVVYLNGSFYYHAWNRVYVGQWIDVDATFGEHVADATHISFAEGGIENQAYISNLLGRLGIKVIDVR
jgi:hypothetical protein